MLAIIILKGKMKNFHRTDATKTNTRGLANSQFGKSFRNWCSEYIFADVFESCRDGNSSNQVKSVHENRYRRSYSVKNGHSLYGDWRCSLKQQHDIPWKWPTCDLPLHHSHKDRHEISFRAEMENENERRRRMNERGNQATGEQINKYICGDFNVTTHKINGNH